MGGGIRTVEKALEYLNAGACKVTITTQMSLGGSKIASLNAQVVIGTSAKPEFLKQLPRDRVVVALDARHGEVVVEGWKTKTGRSTSIANACSCTLLTSFLRRCERVHR